MSSPLYKGDNIIAAGITDGDHWDLLANCSCGAPLQVTPEDDGDHSVACNPCGYQFRTDEDGIVNDPPRHTRRST